MDVDRLRTLPLFASLSEDELRRVAPLAVQRTAAEGTLLANGREELLLLDQGTAEIWCGERRIGELGPGDYFTPDATVVATSPVRLVALDIDAARRLALT